MSHQTSNLSSQLEKVSSIPRGALQALRESEGSTCIMTLAVLQQQADAILAAGIITDG